MRIEIKDLNRLALNTDDGNSLLGTNQEWFNTVWQRMAGCGPSVASNILLYQGRSGRVELPNKVRNKETLVQLMEYAWKHITPGIRGVNKTSMFYEGLDQMLEERNSELRHIALDINKDQGSRPPLEAVTLFIEAAFQADSPLAFLNLDSGDVKDLEDWHWMTAYALEKNKEGQYMLSINDNNKLQTIDLDNWLKTSKLGGGFVYVA